MNLDPNGHIRPDPDAPSTLLGRLAVLIPGLVLVGLAAYGLYSFLMLVTHGWRP